MHPLSVSLKSSGSRWEKVGTLLSVACAIECALLPFVVAALPVLGLGFLSSPWVEALICVGAISLCTFNQVRGFRRHQNVSTLILLGLGSTLLIAAHVLLHGTSAETALSIAGALSLVSAQLVNRRLSSGCACAHHGQSFGATAPVVHKVRIQKR